MAGKPWYNNGIKEIQIGNDVRKQKIAKENKLNYKVIY